MSCHAHIIIWKGKEKAKQNQTKPKTAEFYKNEHMNQGRINMHTETGSFTSLFFFFFPTTLAERKMPHQLLQPKLWSFSSYFIEDKESKQTEDKLRRGKRREVSKEV